MRIVVGLPQIGEDVDAVLRAAVDSEEAGAWGVSVFDHLEPPWRPGAPCLEGWALLAAVARRTSRVRLVSLVTRAGIRPPALVTRMASLVAGASRGRLVLGLGMGDTGTSLEERRFGIPTPGRREERAAQIAETVGLLTDDPTLRPEGVSPEVWVGGTSARLVDLAAALGAGWHGWALEGDRFAALARRYRERRPEGACWWGGIFEPRGAGKTLDVLRGAGADGVTWTIPSARESAWRPALLELLRSGR